MDNHYTFPPYSGHLGQGGHQPTQLTGLPHLATQHHSTSQTLPSLSGAGLPVSAAYGHAGTQSVASLPSHTPSSSVSSISGFGYHHQNGQALQGRSLQLPMPQPPLRPVEPSSNAPPPPPPPPSSSAYASMMTSSYVTSAPSMPNANYAGSLINIQPRPQELYGQPQNYPSLSHLVPTQSSSLYLPPMDTQPTHVVGQQGRRGVLPSVSGKEAPVTAKGVVPQKASDGKYHCEFCTRTYQHAKHLKRHHLRHTGERPYMCNLCSDTFSRSDILKRHHQKCAQRRGIPEGTDHLEGSRSQFTRRQRSRPGSRGGSGSASEPASYSFNDMSNTPTPYMNSSTLPDGMSNMYGTQHPPNESGSSTSAEPILKVEHQQSQDTPSYRSRSVPPIEGMAMNNNNNNFDSPQGFDVPTTSGSDLTNSMSAYTVQHPTSGNQMAGGMTYGGHAMHGSGLHGGLQASGAGNGYSYSMANMPQAISIQ